MDLQRHRSLALLDGPERMPLHKRDQLQSRRSSIRCPPRRFQTDLDHTRHRPLISYNTITLSTHYASCFSETEDHMAETGRSGRTTPLVQPLHERRHLDETTGHLAQYLVRRLFRSRLILRIRPIHQERYNLQPIRQFLDHISSSSNCGPIKRTCPPGRPLDHFFHRLEVPLDRPTDIDQVAPHPHNPPPDKNKDEMG